MLVMECFSYLRSCVYPLQIMVSPQRCQALKDQSGGDGLLCDGLEVRSCCCQGCTAYILRNPTIALLDELYVMVHGT